jgi:putative transposase
MQKMGLHAVIRAKKRSRYVSDMRDVQVPNVPKRDFCATGPNQKWATDVIEFNVNGNKLYLSACMDLYNGEIVAHPMARRPVYELVGSTLQVALSRTECTAGPTFTLTKAGATRCSPIERCLRSVESRKV